MASKKQGKSRRLTGQGKGGTSDAALAKATAEVLADLAKMEAKLDAFELAALTADERLHSSGRLRDGEPALLGTVLDTVDAHPGRFQAIAASDHGVDDTVVETAPARTALARRALLAPLAAKLEALWTRVADDVLASGHLVREVTTPAYAIIRANAAVDRELRKAASTALDFYAKQARRRPAPKAKNPGV